MMGMARRVLGIGSAALLAALPLASVSGAEPDGSAHWLIDVYGHPVEPYYQIPGEFRISVPATQAGLEGAVPERCEAIGYVYDLGFLDSLGQILSENQYKNPTKAWAINPPSAQPIKAEKATYPGGPRALGDCTEDKNAVAVGTLGPVADQALSFEGGSSKSTTTKVSDNLVVSESTNRVTGVKAGELSIASVLSWMKVEFHPSAEPKVSYRVQLAGLNDGKSYSGAEQKGLVLAGQGIAGGDLAKQFNEQAKANKDALKALGQYGFQIFEPKVGYSASGRYVLESAALDGVFFPTARQGTIGQAIGFRLGVSRAAGRFEKDGYPAPHEGYQYMADPALGVS